MRVHALAGLEPTSAILIRLGGGMVAGWDEPGIAQALTAAGLRQVETSIVPKKGPKSRSRPHPNVL